MSDILASLRVLPLFAACAWAAASYPTIPKDTTTPVHQRIAVKGPNGAQKSTLLTTVLGSLTIDQPSLSGGTPTKSSTNLAFNMELPIPR